MDASDEDQKYETKSNLDEMRWTDVKQIQHRYLINFPKKLKKELPVEVELPYPILDPVHVTDHDKYGRLFESVPKIDTRLAFCRKMYSKSNQKLLKKSIDENQYLELPRYMVQVASGAFENCEDCSWHYTGGTLDCFSLKNSTYVVKLNSDHIVQVIDIKVPTATINLKLDKHSPIYNVKARCHNENVFIMVRQKCKVSLFYLTHYDCLQARCMWKIETANFSFIDVAFNEYNSKEMSVIDNVHNLMIKDFKTHKDIGNHSFLTNSTHPIDHLAQIDYIDANTLCLMTRHCFYIVDTRSFSIQKSFYLNSWLKCDNLCTFLKDAQKSHSICASSTHNVVKLDIRSLRFGDKVSHMLSTPPFLSSMITNPCGEYISLFGEHVSDKVLLYSCSNSLNIPQYVPNTRDTLIATSLSRKINHSDSVEKRLTLPILGLKLYNDDVSGNVVLFTSNSVGDVFKQKVSQTVPTCVNAVSRLADWINIFPYKPKTIEATSICNLSNTMHAICNHFPKEQKLIALMKENKCQKLFEKNFAELTRKLGGSVGEAMNAIWTEDKVVTDDSGISSSLSSKHKVSEWLDSVPS